MGGGTVELHPTAFPVSILYSSLSTILNPAVKAVTYRLTVLPSFYDLES